MYFQIKILSKNKISIKKFLLFFYKNKQLKLNVIFKYFNQPRNKRIFSILKSPHVNKTAQEQFEYIITTKKINIYSFKIIKFLIFIKKIQNKLFSDIKLEIKFLINKKLKKKIKKKIFNPNNFKINNKKLNIQKYLKIFDIFGETLILKV
jgi:ribosomal protein S10